MDDNWTKISPKQKQSYVTKETWDLIEKRDVAFEKGNFKDGEQHGLLKYFSEDGSLQRSYKYENGEMIID